jgi:Skp family chaperone for outer membrane proteins
MRVAVRAFTIFVVFAVLTAGSLWAQDTASATPQNLQSAGVKIAFLNFAQVLEGTEEAKLEVSGVRTFMDQQQSAFDQQSKELEQLKQQFAAQERTLNAQTRAEMQTTISEKERNLRRFQEDTQLEINKMRDTLFARLSNKIQPLMSEYAEQRGIAAIFFLDQLQGYFSPGLDVTQEIIQIYNERYPVSQPATGTP